VSDDLAARLADALAPVLGDGVVIEGLERLSGGASRETWRFDAVAPAGAGAGGGGEGATTTTELILRRDPPQRLGAEGAMGREAQAIGAAGAAGLRVPAVLLADPTGDRFGSPGMVMARVAGETIARKILRDDAYAEARPRLAGQCGDFLARLHQLPVDTVDGLAAEDPLATYRSSYDLLDQPSATFELAFRWLEARRPPATGETVVHGDFRLGNLIVDAGGLAAVLDWELVHRGDPVEDLGWLCTKAWRFGAAPPVGGFGERDELLDAYRAAGGRAVSPELLAWWEVVGTLKWGVICMAQAAVHLTGVHRSVELAAIGRRVCEQEADLLELIAPDQWATVAPPTAPARLNTPAPPTMASAAGQSDAPAAPGEPPPSVAVAAGSPAASAEGLHGRPTAVELLEAVGEFLDGDVSAATTGRVRFHTRVASRVVAMVAREIAAGSAPEARYREGLARFGAASEGDLAAAVRRGDLDHRTDELAGFLARSVADKLAIAHPPPAPG
jgi:aminoglycoside phosphotransferase (APT) family kinase protein